MKIEEGEYVRTKNGTINKILKIVPYYENDKLFFEKSYVYTEDFYQWKIYQLMDIVKKHSKNIIDLIEVGDYVNGIEVIKIYEKGQEAFGGYVDKRTIELKNDIYETIPTEYLIDNEKDIKTILTHEQYEQNCYRLEENNG